MNKIARSNRPFMTYPQRQQGFTLVELMVALALSLVVVLASVSALLVSRQGFTGVDAASQLRDNARFATDFITRLSLQSGFKDVTFAADTSPIKINSFGAPSNPAPAIFGFNNALLATGGADPLTTVNNNRNTGACLLEGTACDNGSDVLVLRYQTGSVNTGAGMGTAAVDNAMFNCAGTSQTFTPTTSTDVIESILHVAQDRPGGEPSLMCKYKTADGASWVVASTPLVQGVESFQVLYGTDGVIPNTIPVVAPAPGAPDSIPDRYLRADQLTVPGNPVATNQNWRQVRSLRIGLIIRGATNSAQDRSAAAGQALYPFGKTGVSSGIFDPLDRQTQFVQVPSSGVAGTGDGRLRQVVTFTIYLHNFIGS